jgi:peptide-methionine (S)-S-oxide reductase
MDEDNIAVLGGGCFWCIEALFERVEGILSAESGYSGGSRENPTYEQVSSGSTGHAEVVKLRFDPRRIAYERILDIFFGAHDPTTVDRQGSDMGSQYRSIVLYADDAQKEAARKKIAELDASGAHANRIVTEVVPLDRFWKAEEYHQDYYDKHPYAGYCRVIIAPKLEKAGLTVESLIT